MQIFWALLPLIAFVVSYKLAGIYVATVFLIGVALLQLVVHRWRHGSYKPMHVLVAVLAIVLGGATLLLHDQRYIQWKATVLFWILAGAFLGSQFIGARTLVERLFRTTTEIDFKLDPRHWRALNFAWVLFYAALGALNLYVAWHYSLDTWVNFKAYGLTALNVLFVLPQAFWLAARSEAASQPPGPAP
jgi:intracellular septation protein